MKIRTEVTEIEQVPFFQRERVLRPENVTPEAGEVLCTCDPLDLESTYAVTSDCWPGTIIIEMTSGATCFDVTGGGPIGGGDVLVFIDFLGNGGAGGWELGFDYAGGTPTLAKVPGSGPPGLNDCETPVGNYVGGGCTATVS